jgi:hypothetical protein
MGRKRTFTFALNETLSYSPPDVLEGTPLGHIGEQAEGMERRFSLI